MDRKAGNNLPRKEKKPAFPSPSDFLASQNNIILRESRHHSTSFCFLLNVKGDLNGLPGYISVSLSLLKSSSVSHNHVVTMDTPSFSFHL